MDGTPNDNRSGKYLRRNISDELFRFVFDHDGMMIGLLHVIYPDLMKDVDDKDVMRITLKESIMKGHLNDLGILVKDRLIVLVEAQSTWPLDVMYRFSIYYVETLNYLRANGILEDGNTNLHIGFYVIFTGNRKEKPEVMSLRDMLGWNDVDVTVHFLYGKDRSEGVVYDYVMLTRTVQEHISKEGMKRDAVMSAINKCVKNDILTDFLTKHKEELMSNLDYLFDHKYTDAQYEYQLRQEGIEEGREEGLEKGREEGLEKGREQGREENREEIVIEMLRNGYSVEEISKITKFSSERIEDIGSKLD